MSKEQIKNEIAKELDKLSDKALGEMLSFLKSLEEPGKMKLTDKDKLEKILKEDGGLLERLAK